MPLTAADLTRIIKYNAYELGSQAGGPLTWQSKMQLIQNQINFVNANDARFGTDIAGAIQADLDQLDLDDESNSAAAPQGGLEQVDVIRYFPGGATMGFSSNMNRLRRRVAQMLSQTYQQSGEVSLLGRG
jgi:hypothetical protein